MQTVLKTILVFICALSVSGCLHNPWGWREPSASEIAAVHAAVDAWGDGRPNPGECSALDSSQVRITVLPQDELAEACARPGNAGILACVNMVYQDATDVDGTVWIKVVDGVSFNSHHSLIIHEALHVLHGCSYGHGDRRHETPGVWSGEGSVAHTAFHRWKDLYPAGAHQVQPLVDGAVYPDAGILEE